MIKRSGSSEILHDVVEHKGVLNLAGVIAEDLSLGMEGQARQVFEEIDRLLAANGSDRNHLLSALIFITVAPFAAVIQTLSSASTAMPCALS